LAFTNNGATLPQLNQNSTSNATISAPLALNANLTCGGSGNGGVTSPRDFGDRQSGQVKHRTLSLSGANTYSGGTPVTAGTLSMAARNNLMGTGTVTVNSGAHPRLNGNTT